MYGASEQRLSKDCARVETVAAKLRKVVVMYALILFMSAAHWVSTGELSYLILSRLLLSLLTEPGFCVVGLRNVRRTGATLLGQCAFRSVARFQTAATFQDMFVCVNIEKKRTCILSCNRICITNITSQLLLHCCQC